MTRVQAWLAGLFLLASAAVTTADAQMRGVTRMGLDSLRAAVGRRVRVIDAPSTTWKIGTLGPVNDETLNLDDVRIPTQNLVAAQKSLGRATFNPSVVGFVFGMLAGGGVGYAIGNAQRKSNEPNGTQRSVGVALGAAIGAGVGVLVGRALAPEHWGDIRLR